MRAITLCPNCQTQFFVTDAQLEKQKGKVRCGQCLHVFLATEHFISSMSDEDENPESTADTFAETDSAFANNITEAVATEQDALIDETQSIATVSEIAEPTIDATEETLAQTEPSLDENAPVTEDAFLVGDYIPGSSGKKVKPAKAPLRSARYFKLMSAPLLLILLCIAIAQTVYFSRSNLAAFYPVTKPYLVKMCALLKCKISLPAHIEHIVIDDSDIQEDADYADLMRFSSTLLNRAPFAQQFPNLELTLTDLDDEAKLRRVFTPREYLPSNVNALDGMTPGREFKIKLAIQAKNTVVSGYRVSINY